MGKTIAFTGHRPQKIGGFNPKNPIALKVKQQLKELIEIKIKEGYDTFISGGALGLDQYAAEIVLELKNQYPIKLIIARPFPSQDKVWPQESRDFFSKICEAADLVVDVSADPYANWKMQKRNEYMINHADAIIAVYDGTAGGTANAINYAEKKGKIIYIIKP